MTPSPRLMLIQKDQRLRLAAREIMREIDEREKKDKAIRHDLTMLLAALDDYEQDQLQP